MAAIDKTYLTYSDYLILKEWCDKTKLVYDNGVEGSPKDFLFSYNEPYEGIRPIWNTPEAFDRWLYKNCPFDFIQNRLKEQYHDIEYLSKPLIDSLERGTHYTILNKPKYNFRDNHWYINIIGVDGVYWYYGWDSKTWYSFNSLMPSETCSSCACVNNLTKRKLNRLIKKWKLPIGTILAIYNRFIGSEFKIIIRK